MQTDRYATLTSAGPDPHGASGPGTVNAALRAEALRQLRSQQRDWTRILATDAPGLIAGVAQAGFTDGLDLLREAGKHVPPWLYRRGAGERSRKGASGTTRVSLTVLLADLTLALAWFDPELSAWDQTVSAQPPQPGADDDRGPHGGRSAAPTPAHPAPGVQIPPGAGAPERASGGERPRGRPRGAGQGGGSVTWKPTAEGHDAAAGDWIIGDRVTARATATTVRAGSCGTVVGFSGVGGHPLVDFDGAGRVLIRADHLRRDGDAPPEARSLGRPRSFGTTRLSATPRPPTLAAAPAPPPADWFDRQPPPLW